MNDQNEKRTSAAPLHQPVMVPHVLRFLDPKPGMVCLDCTVGLGGHAKQVVGHLAPGGRYIGLDVDPQNLAIAQNQLSDAPVSVDLVNANFATAPAVLDQLGVTGVDLVLADLGFASNQVSDATRGLSFNTEGPLDMRLDPRLEQTAADLVNGLSQQALADLIYRYGQDRRSRKIAQKIVEHRRESPIKTTTQLAELVRWAYGPARRLGGGGGRRIDPATRTFMALRMAVNAETAALDRFLKDLPTLLRMGAVAVIISFHSLEDRPVKRLFADLCRARRAEKLTPKPVVADQDERRVNPRSRSAKLRAIRWIDAHAQSVVGC